MIHFYCILPKYQSSEKSKKSKKGLGLCCSVLRCKARCRRGQGQRSHLAPGGCVSGCSCGCLSCWNDSSRQASLLDREHFTQQQMPQALKYLLPLNGQGLALPQHYPEGWAGASRELRGSHFDLSAKTALHRGKKSNRQSYESVHELLLPWKCSVEHLCLATYVEGMSLSV